MKKRKLKNKPYKKGTAVVFHSSCDYAGCTSEDEVILDRDYTEEELCLEASDRALEVIQPEGWFTVKGEE